MSRQAKPEALRESFCHKRHKTKNQRNKGKIYTEQSFSKKKNLSLVSSKRRYFLMMKQEQGNIRREHLEGTEGPLEIAMW